MGGGGDCFLAVGPFSTHYPRGGGVLWKKNACVRLSLGKEAHVMNFVPVCLRIFPLSAPCFTSTECPSIGDRQVMAGVMRK